SKLLPLEGKPWEVVQVGGEQPAAPGWTLLSELEAEQRPVPESARVGADGVLIQLFTSGTTGTPKAVPVPVQALASMTRYLLEAARRPVRESGRVGAAGVLIQLFTSGTAGPPRAVADPVKALASMTGYRLHAIDLRPDDVFFSAADPGWAYGLYYAILGPMAL